MTSVFIGSGHDRRTGRNAERAGLDRGRTAIIRSGCYVRENVIVGNGVVMGNSCEFKNCILFDEAQIPHFSYVGDSDHRLQGASRRGRDSLECETRPRRDLGRSRPMA